MEIFLLVLRLLLAGVFAIAGIAKLADLAGSRRAISEWGLPALLSRPLGIALPLVELGVALLLLPATTAWWGATGALALLLLFMIGIAVNLARGKKPDCHCFGQIYSQPVGGMTLLRNTLLAVIAGVVVWQAGNGASLSAVGWLGRIQTTVYVAMAGMLLTLGIVAVEGWAVLNLLRQNGRLLLRVEALEHRLGLSTASEQPAPAEGLPIDSRAPGFNLSGLFGESLTLDALRASGKRVVLLFSDPGCGPCNSLLPDIARWQREHGDQLVIASISRGSIEVNRAKSAEHGLTHVLLQIEHEVGEQYKVNRTPAAVLINADGTIGSSLAAGPDAIRRLIAQSATRPDMLRLIAAPRPARITDTNHKPHPPQEIPRGATAPDVRLLDGEGASVNLSDFRGSQTLVLFWNPNCGFCQRMLPDLQDWEAQPPHDAPRLLIVSTGSAEQHRAMDLHAQIALNEGFSVGRDFGASGTPAAVLIDAKGKVASTVTVGAPAIMNLLRPAQSISNGQAL